MLLFELRPGGLRFAARSLWALRSMSALGVKGEMEPLPGVVPEGALPWWARGGTAAWRVAGARALLAVRRGWVGGEQPGDGWHEMKVASQVVRFVGWKKRASGLTRRERCTNVGAVKRAFEQKPEPRKGRNEPWHCLLVARHRILR
jgi:hypothetical protein